MNGEDAGVTVGAGVYLADQLVGMEYRQHKEAPAPLSLRLVQLERVVEVEEFDRPGTVVHQPIERRQQRSRFNPSRRLGIRIEIRHLSPSLHASLLQLARFH